MCGWSNQLASHTVWWDAANLITRTTARRRVDYVRRRDRCLCLWWTLHQDDRHPAAQLRDLCSDCTTTCWLAILDALSRRKPAQQTPPDRSSTHYSRWSSVLYTEWSDVTIRSDWLTWMSLLWHLTNRRWNYNACIDRPKWYSLYNKKLQFASHIYVIESVWIFVQ